MRKLFIAAGVCLFGFSAIAQQKNTEIKGASQVRMSETFGIPDFVKYKEEAQYPATEFTEKVKDILGFNTDDKLVGYQKDKDDIGYSHTRFQQFYKGVPVQFSDIIMHEKEGRVVSFNGNFFPGISMAVLPALSWKKAFDIAKNFSGGKTFMWEDAGAEAVLKNIKNDKEATYFPKGELMISPKEGKLVKGNFRLCYRFDIYATNPMSRQEIFVDAQSGEIIFTNSLINDVNSKGTAKTRFAGTHKIGTDSTGKTNFRLRQTTHGNGIETYNLQQGTNYGAAVDFTDADNYWNNVNSKQDETATDAHMGAEKTWEFYYNLLGRNSVDNKGQKLLSYCHYSVGYNNANWNGTYMTYGDGDGSKFYPFQSLDVAGHEMSHGVTSNSSKLVYSYESGALNESFSDIFGNSVELFAAPNYASWAISEKTTISGKGFRNMSNPNIFSHPDTYKGNFWYTGTADNGGVHTNSGVQNYWYYLLTDGDTGTNDIGNKFSVTGIGLNDAAKIAYRNNAYYLVSSSQYADARFYAIQSAEDLFGKCSNQYKQNINAWYAVGVGSKYDSTTRPMTGTYTIGGTTPDYATFTAAANRLNKYGVCGAVTFLVRDGMYNEQIRTGSLPGSSMVNTVTFTSENKDSSKVLLYYGTSTSSANNYTLNIDSTQYIYFTKMGIGRTGSNAFGSVVYLSGGASNVSLLNNKISGIYTGNTGITSNNSLVYTDNSKLTYIYIRNNNMRYGSNSVYLSGNTSNNPSELYVENNLMDSFGLCGVYGYYFNKLYIYNNFITTSPKALASRYLYGMKLEAPTGLVNIASNKIQLNSNDSIVAGMELIKQAGTVYNNFISVNSSALLASNTVVLNASPVNLYFNNLLNKDSLSTANCLYHIYPTSAVSHKIQNNNIINADSGYAFNSKNGNISSSDYNNIWSKNSKLGMNNGTSYANLSAWQTGTGSDKNSVSVNPNYTSFADLHVSNDTLNAAAISVSGISNDIDGEHRSTKSDIGADEFVPTSSCLKGTYTVGGTSPDYITITAAVNDVTSKGICSAVTFSIRDGIYTEKIRLTPVPGASKKNIVTFTSASNDSSKVIIRDSSSASTSYPNYTLMFDSVNWVTVQKITIQRTGTQINCKVVLMGTAANNNILQNCILKTHTQSIKISSDGVLSGSYFQNVNIYNNYILGGSKGVYVYDGTVNCKIVSNIIDSFSNIGIVAKYNGDNNSISGNKIYGNYSGVYGISVDSCLKSITIKGNVISLTKGGTGLSLEKMSYPVLIANNSIAINGGGYGIKPYLCYDVNIIFNSVHMFGTDSFSYAFYGDTKNFKLNFLNNNFINSEKGYAFYAGTNISGYASSDYNNIYSNGHYTAFWGGYPKESFAYYKSSCGMDLHSVSLYPNFTSFTNLLPKSAGIDNIGKSSTLVTDDLTGKIRSTSAPDIGAYEFTSYSTDAGVSGINNPGFAFCAGSTPVSVYLKNYGAKTITSATLNWSVNGVTQTSVSFSGSLNPKTKTSVSLGSYTSVTSRTDVIKVWSSSPNGNSDSFPMNDTIAVSLTPDNAPKGHAGKDTTICSGSYVQIGITSTNGYKYSWTSSPSGYTSTTSSNYVNPSSKTIYILQETTYAGCVTTDSITIDAKTKPAAKTGSSTAICAGQSVTIGGSPVTGNTYSWTSNPSGFTSTQSNPTVKPKSSATYYLIENNGGCTATGNITITVYALPPANAGADNTICEGSVVTIGTSSVSGNKYAWTSNPSGFTSASAAPNVTPSVTTIYYLLVTNKGSSCTNADTVTITVNPAPKAIAGKTDSVCLGSSIQLGDKAVNTNSYSWSSSPTGFSSSVSNPMVTPSVATTYTLVETDTASKCSKTNSVTISMKQLPNARFTIKTITGSVIKVTAADIYLSKYAWKFPDGYTDTSSGYTAQHTFTSSASGYYYLVSTGGNGCMNTDSLYGSITGLGNNIYSKDINIYPNPTADEVYMSGLDEEVDNIFVLRDVTGRLIFSEAVKGSSMVKLSLSSLAKGVYMLEVKNSSNTSTHRLIKE